MAEEEEGNPVLGPTESEDESDADYVPSEHSASEEDGSGDDEEAPLASDEKKSVELTQISAAKQVKEKSRTDTLWASFMADVGPRKNTGIPPQKSNGDRSKINGSTSHDSCSKIIPGSQVMTPSTIDVLFSSSSNKTSVIAKDSSSIGHTGSNSSSSGPDADLPKKRPGGLSSVLGFINKKQKVSTLDKSHLDWQKYKQEQGLNEELSQHNRSKNSYLEKQDFLQRTDHRQFEKERDMRLASSAKRKKP